jgi:hypothetical protein
MNGVNVPCQRHQTESLHHFNPVATRSKHQHVGDYYCGGVPTIHYSFAVAMPCVDRRRLNNDPAGISGMVANPNP